ncbi:MAG: hypothetical protein PUA56_06100 [Bacillales bacterium]|nr:hypothetical protein [Bacillales bacterium]
MDKLEKAKKAQMNKNKGKKIAEIIWLSVGGIIMFCGFACVVLSILINNIGTDHTSMYSSPLYPLITAQDKFVTWWNGWCFFKMNSFAGLGIVLLIIACVYLLIVLAVYASQQDLLDKKDRARKLRERNSMKFLEEQKANEDAKNQELSEAK